MPPVHRVYRKPTERDWDQAEQGFKIHRCEPLIWHFASPLACLPRSRDHRLQFLRLFAARITCIPSPAISPVRLLVASSASCLVRQSACCLTVVPSIRSSVSL